MTGPASAAARDSARQLALKIDVDTLRGTLEGVPRLVELLKRLKAGATFFFSVGPDHTGRAVKRVFRSGFLGKVRRTSVVEHYGWKTLLYGTLLPGPNIGRRAGAQMCAVRDAGFEVGLHSYDHVRWQDGVEAASASWTRAELEKGIDAFTRVFGEPPQSHAAAGWQINAHALRLESYYGFRYASDTRGLRPFLPNMADTRGTCVQIPTTLPTLDELLGVDGHTADDAVRALLHMTRARHTRSHVFTLHAELEGQRFLTEFERLLGGWRSQGIEFVSMRELFERQSGAQVPRHAVELHRIAGRSGTLAVQGRATTDARAS
ncbi:MAG TPA: polysaccharide deacetylase family protein [Steroidobacteraceae bacterium]|nr:polysaccharide deacetylase family protein [Steroidobacteraceae bacterium]